MGARPSFSQVGLARKAGGRAVRLGSGHGSAGPPGSVFGLIRTGWRALPIRFPGRRLRHQRPLAAPPAARLYRLDGHAQLVERDQEGCDFSGEKRAFQLYLPKEVVASFNETARQAGLGQAEAIDLFLAAVANERGIPFPMRLED